MTEKNSIDLFFFVNSYIDKKGSIGFRAGKILHHVSNKNIRSICLCKSYSTRVANVEFYDLFLLKIIIKLIKLLRILTKGLINHRIIDIYLFEKIAIFLLKTKYRKCNIKVAHLWDYCPKLIAELKKRNVYVILDIPIAPASYAKYVSKRYDLNFMKQSDSMLSIQKSVYRAADKIIAPSRFVQSELEKIYIPKNKVSIVEFGAEKLFSDKVFARKYDQNETNFCFLGVANPRKGLLDILSVWEDPIFENDKLHLCGYIYPEILRIIKQKKFKNVISHGFINPYDLLPNFDIFLLPSWMEGSSKSVYDAMACGLPSIVTYSCGSIIKHGKDGFVINAGDRDSLKKFMVELKRKKILARNMGQNARENVSRYTWTRYAERITSIYKFKIL